MALCKFLGFARIQSTTVQIQSTTVRIQSTTVRIQSTTVRIQSTTVRIQSTTARIQSTTVRIQYRNLANLLLLNIKAMALPTPRANARIELIQSVDATSVRESQSSPLALASPFGRKKDS
ncbi:hypothetical protein [Nostoc sp.]|uniref:hypothetical protein n=1 Tax=Nostoc sp. TaxID=1180 RepID=UPI002FFC610C